jgi:hypothetical protein
MRLQTKDEAGQPIVFQADDQRVAELNHFFAANPGILGMGVGSRYNRSGAKDATEAQAFAVSQLAYVEQNTFERQYAPVLFETLLPGVISYSAGEWAQSIEYQIVDYAGIGKRMSPAANDVPFADVAYARISKPVAYGGIGYFYNQEELRTSAYLGRPLPTEKLKAAMNGYRRHINTVALSGEAASNFTGLFNNASVTIGTPAAAWVGATADQIISDFAKGIAAVQAATVNNSTPTKVGVPITQYGYLLRPRSTTSDTTILAFIKSVYPGLEVYPISELATAGATNTRMVFWNPTDDNMVLHVPMPLRFLAPQPDVLRVVVPGEYKYGGLEIRRPATVYYIDTI